MEPNDHVLHDEVLFASEEPHNDILNNFLPKAATDIKVILSSFTYEVVLHDKLQQNDVLANIPSREEPIDCLFKYYLEIDVAIDNIVIHSRKSELGDHCNLSFLFDFISYFGTAKFNFKLIKSETSPNCFMTSNKLSIIGTKSIYLYEFFKSASSHSNIADSWYQLYEVPFYCNENESLTKKDSKIQSIVNKSSLNKWFDLTLFNLKRLYLPIIAARYRKLSLNDIDVNNHNNGSSSKDKPSAAYTFFLKFRAGKMLRTH